MLFSSQIWKIILTDLENKFITMNNAHQILTQEILVSFIEKIQGFGDKLNFFPLYSLKMDHEKRVHIITKKRMTINEKNLKVDQIYKFNMVSKEKKKGEDSI